MAQGIGMTAWIRWQAAAVLAAAPGLLGCGGGAGESATAESAVAPTSIVAVVAAAPAPAPAPAPVEPVSVASSDGVHGKITGPSAGPRARAAEAAPESTLAVAPPAVQVPAPAPVVQEPTPLGISLSELVARRDLWPQKVAVKKDIRFQGMAPIAKGTELRVHEIAGTNVVFDHGSVLFDYPAADTDILERARAAIARMTPEQLALTEAKLREHPELWPLQVALTAELGFTNGVTLEVGREVVLRDVQPDGLWLCDRRTGEAFQTAVNETDLLQRARERLAMPEKEREPFFVRALEATIEKDGKIGAPGALAKADLILVYKGRKGCGRCASFLPELKSYYEKTKPANPRFEVVFASQDATPQLAREYLAEARVPGVAIAQERNLEAANLASISGQLLPTVLLFDRKGKLLARNHPNAGSPTASDMLGEVTKRLKERP